MPWMLFKYDASGEMNHGVLGSLSTAWAVGGQWDLGSNGQTNLFYPGKPCADAGDPSCVGGTTDIAVESIRLKRLRDGYEDYEYMVYLESIGRGPDAAAIADALFTNASSATSSSDILSAREQLIAEVLAGPVEADISVTITDSEDPVAAGSQLDLDVQVANAGPETATNTGLLVTLPNEFIFLD